MNTVSISGRVCNDPEVKSIGSGTSVVNVSVAHDKRRKDGDEWVTTTEFYRVTFWAGFAELFAKKARKGDLVFITGELSWRQWEDQNSNKRESVEITARTCEGEWVFRKADGSDTPAPSQPAAQPELPAEPAPWDAPAGGADDDIPF